MDVRSTNQEQLCDAFMPTWIKISEESFQHFVECVLQRFKAVVNKYYWPITVEQASIIVNQCKKQTAELSSQVLRVAVIKVSLNAHFQHLILIFFYSSGVQKQATSLTLFTGQNNPLSSYTGVAPHFTHCLKPAASASLILRPNFI